MRFDLASDLHLDMYGKQNFDYLLERIKKKPDRSSVIVVAGDVSNGFPVAEIFYRRLADLYDYVLFVDGNHEHYGTGKSVSDNIADISEIACNMFEEYKDKSKIYYLSARKFLAPIVIENTAFVGVNGWYDFLAGPSQDSKEVRELWRKMSNDYKMIIYGDTYMSPWNYAIEDMTDLRRSVVVAADDLNVEEIVIVTHTVPRKDLVEKGKYAGTKSNAFFVNTSMEKVLKIADPDKVINTWCYGHTHLRNDVVIDGIRYVNNSRGYPYDYVDSKEKWLPVTIETGNNSQRESS